MRLNLFDYATAVISLILAAVGVLLFAALAIGQSTATPAGSSAPSSATSRTSAVEL